MDMDKKEFLSKLFKDLNLTEFERVELLKAYAHLCGAESSLSNAFHIIDGRHSSAPIVAMLGYAISALTFIMADEKWITLEKLKNAIDKVIPDKELLPINPSKP